MVNGFLKTGYFNVFATHAAAYVPSTNLLAIWARGAAAVFFARKCRLGW